MKSFFIKLSLAITSLLIAVLAVEWVLRIGKPMDIYSVARPMWAGIGSDLYEIDPDFGYRPILDNGVYSEYGTRANDYDLEKPDGVERVLFLGDSATARAKVIDALKAKYGGERFEYWNAGVESYNTLQEIAFYRAYNHAIQPDRVVICFHFNDFITTPIAMPGPEGKINLYSPRSSIKINPWLLKRSQIYKRYLSLVLARGGSDNAIYAETHAALQGFKAELEAEGVALRVMVLPVMNQVDQWKDWHIQARDQFMEICRDLGVPFVDLKPALMRALEAGVDPMEEPGDFAHPSDAVSVFFAEDLVDGEILGPLVEAP